MNSSSSSSFAAIRKEFESNGITRELDEMDKLILECRRKKNVFLSPNISQDIDAISTIDSFAAMIMNNE